jgi:hypothetical protein
MPEKKLFGAEHETNCNITFLAEHDNKVRLMSFRSDPWLREDAYPDEYDFEHSFEHSIFLFNGAITDSKIYTEDETKKLSQAELD